MPNLSSLVTASLRNDPNAQRLDLIQRIESWLWLPPAQAGAQSLSSVTNEGDARKLNDMLMLVRGSLFKDLGITSGPDGEERFKKLIADYSANALGAEQRAMFDRLSGTFEIGAALLRVYPALASPPAPPPDEAALRAQLDALYQRQQEAQKYTVPPNISEPRLDTMAALVADYRTLLNAVAPDRRLYTDISFFAASAAFALARGWQLTGHTDRAARCYADASSWFEQGNRPSDAEDARKLARDLGFAVRSDFDGASASELRTLLDGHADAFTRARAYERLSSLAASANSAFDAAHYAEQAAGALVSLGYLDPEAVAFDTAFQAWIDTCSRADAEPADRTALERIKEVARMYLAILGMRLASRIAQDPAAAAGTETTLEKLCAAVADTIQQVGLAHTQVSTALARYRP